VKIQISQDLFSRSCIRIDIFYPDPWYCEPDSNLIKDREQIKLISKTILDSIETKWCTGKSIKYNVDTAKYFNDGSFVQRWYKEMQKEPTQAAHDWITFGSWARFSWPILQEAWLQVSKELDFKILFKDHSVIPCDIVE
jgi:tRNA G46 methylase TrmB